MDMLKLTYIKTVDLNEIRNRLNPVWVEHQDPSQLVKIYLVDNPMELMLHPNRLDIFIKYLYVKFRSSNIDSDFHVRMYKDHIESITLGNFHEFDGRKNKFEDYKNQFDDLIQEIEMNSFDAERSMIPINPEGVVLEGAHRVSICAYFNIPITVAIFDGGIKYDYSFFLKRKFDQRYLDYVAFEYSKLNKNTFIAVKNPIAIGHEIIVEQLLNKFGRIYYKKNISIDLIKHIELVKLFYKEEPWIGKDEDGFAGARQYAINSLVIGQPMTIYLFECNELIKVQEIKKAVRALYDKGNYPMHINDFHGQTIEMGKVIFHENSLHLLGVKKPKNHSNFTFKKLFSTYKGLLKSDVVDSDLYCITGSSTMALYGLRDVNDLDYVCHSTQDELRSEASYPIQCQNKYFISKEWGHSLDDVIFDPFCHLYYEGLKFISLNALRWVKSCRLDLKDVSDIRKIDKIRKRALINPIIIKKLYLLSHMYLIRVKKKILRVYKILSK